MSATHDMKVDPARATTLIDALRSVSARINHVAQGREVSGQAKSYVGCWIRVREGDTCMKTNQQAIKRSKG